MKLPKVESVSVKGFKSFSHPVTFNFDEGITAIVGPNGSGKSNIIDVISFVMGSLSFSSMRSKRARELLYIGKTTRANQALVELKITDPQKKASDEPVLKISRKLFSDGTSVYRINGKKTTRLSVIDALTTLNIFSDGHNMVKQGDITKFVKMSPSGRKHLIDTIAGIELYEKKKTRALTDLNEVEMKIEKVTAVHDERLRVYRNLKEECERVERFYELKALEKRAHLGLLLKKQEMLNAKFKKKQSEKEATRKKIANLEKQLAESKAKLKKFNEEMETEGMAQRIDVIRKVEELRFEIEKLENSADASAKSLETLQNRQKSLNEQLDALFNRKKQIENALQTQGPEIEALNSQISELKKKQAKFSSEISKLRQDYAEKKRKAEEAQQQKNNILVNIRELELEKESHENFIRNLRAELARLKQKKLLFEAERQKMFDNKKRAEVKFREVNAEIKALENDVESLRSEKEKLLSSGMPPGSKKAKSSGFLLLGDTLSEEQMGDVAPFIFSPRISDGDFPKLKALIESENLWTVAVSDKVSIQELKSKMNGLKVVGSPSKFDFESEDNRRRRVKAVSDKIRASEEKLNSLRETAFKLKADLKKTVDNSVLEAVQARQKEVRDELKHRQAKQNEIAEKLARLQEKLKAIKVEKVDIPNFSVLEDLNNELTRLESRKISAESELRVNKETLETLILPEIGKVQNLLQEIAVAIRQEGAKAKKLQEELLQARKQFKDYDIAKGKLESEIKAKLEQKNKLENKVNELSEGIYSEKANLKIIENTILELENDARETEERQKEFEGIKPVEDARAVLQKVIKESEALGELNFRAHEDFKKVKELVEKIQNKLEKLSKERDAIVKLMNEIEQQKVAKFMETFEGIRGHFRKIFKTVLKGEADLEIEKDEEGISGVLITVRLNDRDLSVDALSGGQKTLAALAFIFAIQYFKPSPLYIFDEVEAALDKHNSEKFANLLKDMARGAQVLIVTHNDHIVKVADQIIGVYMRRGMSRIISLPKEKVLSEEKWLSRSEAPADPDNM